MAENLLLEIGTEELPSGAVDVAIEQLLKNAEIRLKHSRLSFSSLRTFGTPRRLVLMVDGLSEHQDELVNEVKGPPRNAAYDRDGNVTKAAIGFAKAHGVNVDDLTTKQTVQGEYVFAVKKEAGNKTVQLLPEVLSETVASISFPKSMRWNRDDVRFARPVRWLLALYGKQVLTVSLGELKSGSVTWGHRLLTNKPLTVAQPQSYFSVMKEAHVVCDQERRIELIRAGIENAVQEISQSHQEEAQALINPRVLSEVVHLVEYPRVIWGRFSEDFLAVPQEVLVTAMESHQRYFPVQGRTGLLPAFIVVHNGDPAYDDIIRRGHERVLGTRLADAKFFFEADQKSSLAEKVESLKDVVFQEQLGTLYEKTGRVKILADHVGTVMELGDRSLQQLERAAHLCKADLVTEIVKEFPTLQGVMGNVYAKLSGEPDDVAEAIAEHYLPRTAGDKLPETTLGAALSLADKIDTIVGCFLVGLIPTGSEDPYALRRQAQGVISILFQDEIPLSPSAFIDEALENYKHVPFTDEKRTEIIDFVLARLRAYFLQEGARQDIVGAALETPFRDVMDLGAGIRDLSAFPRDQLESVWTVFTRLNNLKDPSAGTDVVRELLAQAEEKNLVSKLEDAEARVHAAVAAKDYRTALNLLEALRPVIDTFFDAVLVMEKDERVRRNRLAILNKSLAVFLKVADFSRLVFEGQPSGGAGAPESAP